MEDDIGNVVKNNVITVKFETLGTILVFGVNNKEKLSKKAVGKCLDKAISDCLHFVL